MSTTQGANKVTMNLLSQLNAAAGRKQSMAIMVDTSLFGQLRAAADSRQLGLTGNSRRVGNNTRKAADAAWKKAFNGEERTPPELEMK